MAVFRIEKTRDYTVMSNHHLRDKSLSLKEKGLLSLMLSLPEEPEQGNPAQLNTNRSSKEKSKKDLSSTEGSNPILSSPQTPRGSDMSRLLPYETILKAREGDPEAVNAVLLHYAGYIRYFSKVNGQVNAEVEDYVKQRLIDCQFKFRLDEPPDKS